MQTPNTTPGATKQSEQTHGLYLLDKSDLASYEGFLLGFLDGKSGGILDNYTMEEFLEELYCNPNMQLWIGLDKGIIEGLMITHFIHVPKGKVLLVGAVNCTKFRKYMRCFDKVEKWAFNVGCVEILFDGPEAWSRLWTENGFTKTSVRFAKSLTKKWGH